MSECPYCCLCMNGRPKRKGCTCLCHEPWPSGECKDCGATTLTKDEDGNHIGCQSPRARKKKKKKVRREKPAPSLPPTKREILETLQRIQAVIECTESPSCPCCELSALLTRLEV